MREIHRLIDGAEHRYGDVAVFYRTNAQSRVLEESLVRSGVPYRVFGGVKFYDRREIKDALAYLRALVNPDDEVSWKRIVNTPRARCRRHVGREDRRRTRSGAGVTFPAAIENGGRRGRDRQGARRAARSARADGRGARGGDGRRRAPRSKRC